VAFADDNSIVDREVAWRAGIGWFGKNANLLLPQAGSWFVLGCVITDAPLPVAPEPVADGCGTCHRCIDACPTGAIIEPGVIDGNRCLAWLLQKPGVFPREHRVALGDRLYGCDDCQEVCPPNVRFAASRGELGPPAEVWVNVTELLEADDKTLLARHGRFYIAGRDPRWLRRNALIVLGNIGDGIDRRTGALLEPHLGHSDPILRAHAVWAAARLGRDDLLPTTDPDPMVVAELHDLPAPRPTSR
jgi:epoxyqueuosine reductase